MNTIEASARKMLSDHADDEHFDIRDYPRGYEARVWLHQHALGVGRWLAFGGETGVRFFTTDPDVIRKDAASNPNINPASGRHGPALADMLGSRAQAPRPA